MPMLETSNYKVLDRTFPKGADKGRVLDVPFVQLTKRQQGKVTAKDGNKPRINPGRLVTVRSINLKGGSNRVGWKMDCWNCTASKKFLSEHFKGDDNAYALANAAGIDHVCAPPNWRSAG